MNVDDIWQPDDLKRFGLLMLLVKLDVLGIRKVRFSMAAMMVGMNVDPPPCSIPLAITGLSKDYLQFVPKAKYRGEEWYKV